MDPAALELVRTRRRMLAARWEHQVAAPPKGGRIWQDRERLGRHLLAGMDAVVEAMATGQMEPFAAFAERFCQEALALETPLEEVIRALLDVKPIVLDLLAEHLPPNAQDPGAIEVLNRLISAGVLEAIHRYERQRSRRSLTTQELLNDLRERARRQVIVDTQTGLFNAGYFATAVRGEVLRSRRFNRTFTLGLVAADHGDEVSELLGPEGMAAMTIHLANLLTRATRHVDLRASLGGCRFGIILPETSLKGAFVLAERVRQAVEHTPLTLADHPYPLTQTVSIGLACFPQDADDDQALLERAEEALARARAGQNTTVSAATAWEF